MYHIKAATLCSIVWSKMLHMYIMLYWLVALLYMDKQFNNSDTFVIAFCTAGGFAKVKAAVHKLTGEKVFSRNRHTSLIVGVGHPCMHDHLVMVVSQTCEQSAGYAYGTCLFLEEEQTLSCTVRSCQHSNTFIDSSASVWLREPQGKFLPAS